MLVVYLCILLALYASLCVCKYNIHICAFMRVHVRVYVSSEGVCLYLYNIHTYVHYAKILIYKLRHSRTYTQT